MLTGLLVLLCWVVGRPAADTGFVTYTDPQDQGAATIRRFILQQGFHRTLVTEVVIGSVAYGEQYPQQCRMLLQESIPAGMYIDIDQIEEDHALGALQILSPTPIDTEKPEYLSTEHQVHVFHPLQATGSGLGNTIALPVHLRYHRPSGEADDVVVPLPPPKLLLRCAGSEFHSWLGRVTSAPCDATNITVCSWKDVHIKQSKEPLLLHVPVGKPDHAVVVMAVTLIVTTGGVLLLSTSFRRNPNERKQERGSRQEGTVKSESHRDASSERDNRNKASKVRLRKGKAK